METSITYDGVQGTEGGGTIFQDKRFWVAQRVPMRSHFVDQIKNNGGTIVPLEKKADFLIADHLRKDAPQGSFSWKLIEDSMKNGCLQLEDKYRIGLNPDSPRPAGAGTLGKKSRAGFTSEEDAILTRFVLSHATGRTGNAIYQQFEAKHPTHTWQSWRNRWSKNLSHRSQGSLEALARTAPDESAAQSQPDNQSPVRPSPVPQPPQSPSLQEPTRANISRPIARDHVSPEPEAQPESEPDLQPEHREEPNEDDQEEQLGQDEEPDSDDEDEGGFKRDLLHWAQKNDISIEMDPTIAGKQLNLLDLGEVASNQEVSPEDVNWNQVAHDLGFSRVSREVTSALQQCWEDNLSAFLLEMAEKNEIMAQEEHRGMEDEEDSDEDVAEAEAQVPQATLPSSPPASVQNRKRSRDEDIFTSSRKHQRLDRNVEIPSAPEHELVARRRAPQDDSPSLRKRRFPNLVEVKDSQDDTQAILGNPRTPSTRRSIHDSQVIRASNLPQLGTQQSSFDITPSQQLRHEDRLSGSPEVDLGGRVEPMDEESSSESAVYQADLSTRSNPQNQVQVSPPVRAKPVRRSLPESWQRQLESVAPQPRPQSRAPTQAQNKAVQQRQSRRPPSPDSHDPDNDPDPHPRRDSPNFDTIEGWVEHYQAMGYPHQHVIKALKCTTMTPGGEASHVMESLKKGDGIPTHVMGVWTTRDDKALRAVMQMESGGALDRDPLDASDHNMLKGAVRETKRLTHKHGEDAVELRKQFLEAQDKAAMS